MTDTATITTAIVLAGGEGKRLKGIDKGLQRFKQKSLIEHVLERIEPQVEDVVICANRNIKTYQILKNTVLQDHVFSNSQLKQNNEEENSFQGPMSGISTALKSYLLHSKASAALITSCDTPKLPLDLRQRLEKHLNHAPGVNVAVAYDGNRRQNLHCFIKRAAWGSLIDFFESGGRAMHRWLESEKAIDVDFSDCPHSFNNYNTLGQINQSKTS